MRRIGFAAVMFLAADREKTVEGTDADNVFLSGRIAELQAQMNLTNMVQAAVVQDRALEAFQQIAVWLLRDGRDADVGTAQDITAQTQAQAMFGRWRLYKAAAVHAAARVIGIDVQRPART